MASWRASTSALPKRPKAELKQRESSVRGGSRGTRSSFRTGPRGSLDGADGNAARGAQPRQSGLPRNSMPGSPGARWRAWRSCSAATGRAGSRPWNGGCSCRWTQPLSAKGRTRQAPLSNLKPEGIVRKARGRIRVCAFDRACVESIASENAARFAAMQSACDNVSKSWSNCKAKHGRRGRRRLPPSLWISSPDARPCGGRGCCRDKRGNAQAVAQPGRLLNHIGICAGPHGPAAKAASALATARRPHSAARPNRIG